MPCDVANELSRLISRNFKILGKAQNSIECKYYVLVSFPKKTKLLIKANKFRKTTQLFLMKHTILFRFLGLFIIFSANCSKPLIWLLLIVIFFLLVGYRSSPVESRCSHLNFRYCAWFEQGFPWHSGNYRVWIHSKIRTWHDKNIQSNAPYG